MKSSTFAFISYFTLLLLIGVLGYATYLAYAPIKFIDIMNSPFPVVTPVLHPGDTLSFEVKYCAYRVATGIVSQTVDGDKLIRLPTVFTLHPGCYDVISQIPLPLDMPLGYHTIYNTGVYSVPIISGSRSVTIHSRIQSFKVIK